MKMECQWRALYSIIIIILNKFAPHYGEIKINSIQKVHLMANEISFTSKINLKSKTFNTFIVSQLHYIVIFTYELLATVLVICHVISQKLFMKEVVP